MAKQVEKGKKTINKIKIVKTYLGFNRLVELLRWCGGSILLLC